MAVRPSASARTNWLSGHLNSASVANPDQAQPFRQLHEEMSRALDCIASPNVDEVLDDHGLVSGRSPQERCSETRELGDAFQDVRALHRTDHRIRQGGEGMVRGSQQDAAQSHTVAGNWKGDDLTLAIGQVLVTAGPASLKNEGLVSGLPLLGELLAALHRERPRLYLGEPFQLSAVSGRNMFSFFARMLSKCIFSMSGSPHDQRRGSGKQFLRLPLPA